MLKQVNQFEISERVKAYVLQNDDSQLNAIFFNFRIYPAFHKIIIRKLIATEDRIELNEVLSCVFIRFTQMMRRFRELNKSTPDVRCWGSLLIGYFNACKNHIVSNSLTRDRLYSNPIFLELDKMIEKRCAYITRLTAIDVELNIY